MKNKILVVDDDAELCEEMAEILSDSGLSVVNTSDCKMVGQLLKEHSFDAAILDFKMPGKSGIDIMKEIKRASPRTSIFLVSGKPFLENLTIKENVRDMLIDVISKPFDIDELIAKVKSII